MIGKCLLSKLASKDDINPFLSLPILADNPVKIKRSPSEPLPKELIGKDFSFKTVMLIGTIDCDIEGKISRRYMMDLRKRKINRLNALTVNDLVNFNMSQVHISHDKFPFHDSLINFLHLPSFSGACGAVQFHRSTSCQVRSGATCTLVQNLKVKLFIVL